MLSGSNTTKWIKASALKELTFLRRIQASRQTVTAHPESVLWRGEVESCGSA